jgi:calcineurin-like phosphoesterase family protein
MDLAMISNWNKTVSPDDTVIHLGDIGNVDILRVLNFKKMYFIPGNYEKKDHSIIEELSEDQRVIICENQQKITLNGKTYYLCHEPINGGGEDKFYLYGHIHRLQMIKKNGINVGQDANRFKPVLVSEIEWMRNAMEKYYDNNVFTDKCM